MFAMFLFFHLPRCPAAEVVSCEQGCDPRNELLIRFVDCHFFHSLFSLPAGVTFCTTFRKSLGGFPGVFLFRNAREIWSKRETP